MLSAKRTAGCDRWFDRFPPALMSMMMCGNLSQVETDATRRVGNPNRCWGRNNTQPNYCFTEDRPAAGMQSSVFQDHQYDLLAGRPPSRNPNYVPRSQHPTTTTPSQTRSNTTYRQTSNRRSCPFSAFGDQQYNLLSGNQGQRNSNFVSGESTRATRRAPPFSAASLGLAATNYGRGSCARRSSGSQTGFSTAFGDRHYDLLAGTPPSHNPEFVPPSAAAAAASIPPVSCRASEEFVPGAGAADGVRVPVAEAVVVSDDGDDSGIPMVAALRVGDETETEKLEPHHLPVAGIPVVTGLEQETERVASDAGPSRAHPAVNSELREAGIVEEERPPRSWFGRARASPRSDVREGDSRIPWEEPRRASDQGLGSFHCQGSGWNACGTNRRSSWSRVSTRARETAVETRRSLTKPLGSRACLPSRGKENDPREEEMRMARSAEELAREQKALSKRIARSSRDLTQDQAKPRSRRW